MSAREDGEMRLSREPIPEMPAELKQIIEEHDVTSEISKRARSGSGAAIASGGKLVDYTTSVSDGHGRARCHPSDPGRAGERPRRPLELQGRQVRLLLGRGQRMPKLMCMTRLSELPLDKPVSVEPMRAFPPIKDLVTDVSWNFRVKQGIKKFKPRAPDAPDGTWRMAQSDVDRVQEFRKCIECFLCQDVCHVLRDHQLHEEFIGPRYLVHVAALEMHPLDVEDRVEELRRAHGIGVLQHHQVLHQGLPGAHYHYRQRDHPAQGAGGGRVLRSPGEAGEDFQ